MNMDPKNAFIVRPIKRGRVECGTVSVNAGLRAKWRRFSVHYGPREHNTKYTYIYIHMCV